MYTENTEKTFSEGSGCCAVERAAISNTREPGFESSHGQLYSTFIYCCLNVEKYKEKGEKMKRELKNMLSAEFEIVVSCLNRQLLIRYNGIQI